jgi:membrane-associated HD superfamily phosphohydrolase
MIEWLPYLGLVLGIVAALPYDRDMFRGTTKPNQITAGLWAFESGIALVAAWSEGAWLTNLPVIGAFLCPLTGFILALTLKQAQWKLTPFDWLCGAMSITALLAWWVTNNANWAIFFAIMADVMAAIPTIKKSIIQPESETRISYLIGSISFTLGLFAVKDWSFAEMAFPLYAVFIDGLIAAILYFPRNRTVPASEAAGSQ